MTAPPTAERTDNRAPVIERVVLDPAVLRPGQPVEAKVLASDPDGDAIRLELEWRVNGNAIARGRQMRVSPAELQKGDRVEVVATATDGTATSPPRHASVRVGNGTPLVRGVFLAPEAPLRPGDELQASVDALDPDGDSLRFEYTWMVNGLPHRADGPSFSTGGLKRDDAIRVRVVADDGEDRSRPMESAEIRLANSPPRILEAPQLETDTGAFRYAFEAADPDGDRNLRFRLVEAPRGMTIDPILGTAVWHPDASQAGTHVVEVAVSDPQGDASAMRFEITVTATGGEPPPPASPSRD